MDKLRRNMQRCRIRHIRTKSETQVETFKNEEVNKHRRQRRQGTLKSHLYKERYEIFT